MARVGVARGWHVIISILVFSSMVVVAIATVLLPAMGSRWWRLHCSSSRHVCSVDAGGDDLGEGGRGLLRPRAGRKRKGGNISYASSTAASRAANRAIQTAHYQRAGWRAKANRATKASKQAGSDMRRWKAMRGND